MNTSSPSPVTLETVFVALEQKKLRVHWQGVHASALLALEGEASLLCRVLNLIREHQGLAPGNSQDETLHLTAKTDGALWRLEGRYTFDHDFASQYDQTETWNLELTRAGGEWKLERWIRAAEEG